MKLIVGILILFIAALNGYSQPIYTSKAGEVSFFSTTPVEDIKASNNSVRSILNTSTREIVFIAPIRQFKFPKALMQEHFNENYLESEKYPEATFKGKINEEVDFSKDGVVKVTATGTLKIHGVEKQTTEKGTLTIMGKDILLHCEMKVKLADYKIEVPKIVFENISEVIDVKLDIPYVPYVKEVKK